MGFRHAHVKIAVVVVGISLLAVVIADHTSDADDLCPSADVTSDMDDVKLVNSYTSVGGINTVPSLCGMQYGVPDHATLYQAMLAASQQHGSNFQFTSSRHAVYGHFIKSINSISSDSLFYWLLFDSATRMTTPLGVDFIDVTSESSYFWHYINASAEHDQSYPGPCGGSSVIPPTMSLSYSVAYLTISSANTGDATNGTFKPVCKRPVLIQSTGTTVFTLLQDANDQLPIYVKAVLDMQMSTVTSINGVSIGGRYKWTGYVAGTNSMTPKDLSITTVTHGDHIEFRFTDTLLGDAPDNGAPSAVQLGIQLSAVMILASSAMVLI